MFTTLPATSAPVIWNHSSGDRNWSTAENWIGGVPANANDIIFSNTDAQTTNVPANTVETSVAVRSLSYTNSVGSAYLSFQNTVIENGQTLTVTNGLNVGVGNSTGFTADSYTYATITGAGTLAVTGGNTQVGCQSANSPVPTYYPRAVLDMRGLNGFDYNSPNGTFMIAGQARARQCGTVYLADANSISASAISLGVIQQNLGSLQGILHLGATNNLFADTITIGKLQRDNLMDFQPGLIDPSVKIRARNGINGVANMYLGWNPNASTSSSHASGTNNFSGGIVDAAITNLYLGWYTGISASGFLNRLAVGSFIMSTNSRNVLVVENLYIGSITNPLAVDNPTAIGLLEVRGGTVTAGNVTLAQQVVSTSTARGTLKLTGGMMNVTGNIIAGGGSSTGIVANATLNVAGLIGNSSQYLRALSLTNATLGLTLLGGNDPSVFATNFTVGSGNTLSLRASPWFTGQFPLIAYSGTIGGLGVSGLTLDLPPGVTATLTDNSANHTVDVVITDIPEIKWWGAASSDWSLAGALNWTKNGTATSYDESAGVGPQVLFDDTAVNTAVDLMAVVSPAGIVARNSTKTYTFTGSGKLSGTSGLFKLGEGTLVLANTTPNDYAGLTTISAGTLQVGNGGTTGSLGAGGVENSATLVFNRSDALLVSGPVSGSGTLRNQGAGVVSIPNVTSYSGDVLIDAGVLALGASGTVTHAGEITGSGSFGVVGGGTVILTNNNNAYSGGSVIYSGTLQIGDGTGNGVLPNGNVLNDGALVVNSPNPLTLAHNISGTGSVASINGDLTLSGVNTHSGSTIRSFGTLIAGSPTGLSPSSTVIVGDISGTGVGTLDCGTYSPVIGGLTVGGNDLFSASSINFGGSGQTLTVNGNVRIGNLGGNTTGGLSVSGNGTGSLVVNTNGGFIQLGLCTSGESPQPNNLNVDFSNLASFLADLGPAGNFWVGDLNANIRSTGSTPYDILTLAVSNVIKSGTLSVGAGGKGFTPELHLGTGTNILNVNALNIGLGPRDSGKLLFASSSGSVAVRGYAGGDSRAALNIGTRTQGTSSAADNTVDFTGHYADLRLETMIIGDQASRVGSWNQTFSFDQGVLDVSSVDMTRACRDLTTGASTLNLHGGIAQIGRLTFMGANTASTATATLDVANGAEVTVFGDILKGRATGTVNLNVSSAILNIWGKAGSAAAPIDNLVLNNAQLNLNISGAANPAIAPVQATAFQPSDMRLAVNGTALTVGQFPLIAYASLGGNGFSGITLVNPPGVSAYLFDNVANSSVDLVVTSLDPLVWSGSPNGNWDVDSTLNWVLGVSPATYSDGSRVLFDDAAVGSTMVTLTTLVRPAAINFNNSAKDYTVAGSGGIRSGGLAKAGSGTLTIESANASFGATMISAGTLLVNGSIGSGEVSVLNGALGGTGTIGGPVTVGAAATLVPGAGGIGTLTVSNQVRLEGTTLMEVNKTAGTKDRLVALGTITYGGTLQVASLQGTLSGGDSFKLFDAASYSGSFSSLVPPAPGAGLTWDTTSLAVDGTLKVLATFVAATNVNLVKVDTTVFQITGIGGANQTYDVWTHTNVTAPSASWWLIGSANADAEGAITFVDTQATNTQGFYRFGQQ